MLTIPRRYIYFKNIILLIGGIYGGIFVSQFFMSLSSDYHNCKGLPKWAEIFPRSVGEEPPRDDLIYIGIMTTRQFLKTRVAACYDTWVKSIPGTVHFYSSEATDEDRRRHPNLKIISIPNTDDRYPPKKKAFMLLKYMYENYGGKYEWFMRADDDSYIKGDKLGEFLRGINSSTKQYVGQMGLGLPEDRLSMAWNENFCIGGPGIILSKALMKAINPFIEYCLENVPTIHDDVGIGRCTYAAADTTCTWNFEAGDSFYQNWIDPYKTFNHSLKMTPVHNAISMHSIKVPSYQYRIHLYLNNRKVADMKQKILKLRREKQMIEQYMNSDKLTTVCEECLFPSVNKTTPRRRGEVLTWDFFTKEHLNSPKLNDPFQKMDVNLDQAVNDLTMNINEMTNEKARQKGRLIKFKELNYGYRRVNPKYGADYVLDMVTKFKKFKGNRMEMIVRRHAYVHRTFTDIEFQELAHDIPHHLSVNATTTTPSMFELEQIIPMYEMSQHDHAYRERVIHFILPFAGRYSTFANFMASFEDACLKDDDKVEIAVIIGKDAVADMTGHAIDYIRVLQARYPQHILKLVQLDVKFSRALAIQRGVDMFHDRNLLFFADVELSITRDLLTRVRMNTVRGEQVYYPIAFKRYNPRLVCGDNIADKCPVTKDPNNFSDVAGHWDGDSYRALSVYKSDFKATGGFNMQIPDWDQEAEDLYQKFMALKVLNIFRAPDPGLIQNYNPIQCDPGDMKPIFESCNKTKLNTVGSVSSMAEYVFSHSLLES